MREKNPCPCGGLKYRYAAMCMGCKNRKQSELGYTENLKRGPIVNRVHGHGGRAQRRSPTYRTWDKMIQRCTNKNDDHYSYYGGRGINVCERWRKFENFLADMGERPIGPGRGFTIDRFPDKNGNYEPGNCRWATWKEQMNNTRRNKLQ
jgi:hypothetical protein